MAETEFRPIWDKNTLRRIISSYGRNPKAYTPSYTEKIQQHANYHGVPFYTGEFSIGDALSDLGKGFFEGFTTLKADDPPDNEYEAIFRNIGHLFGFAPGIMAAPIGGAAKMAAKLGFKSKSLVSAAGLARKLNDYSVPMFMAKHATKGAKKLVKPFLDQGRKAQSGAVNTAANFILGNKARHIAEGAFHLGAASAVSSWQGGVDEMMSSFMHGSVAGGFFRGMGNLRLAESETGNKAIRSMAGSLFMGLPTTMRGATTPEQIHQYLMGAWFGSKERPWTVKKAAEFTKEYSNDAIKNETLRGAWDPEIHPKWEKLPDEVKPVVKDMFAKHYVKNMAAAQKIADETGLDVEAIIEAATREASAEEVLAEEAVKKPEAPKVETIDRYSPKILRENKDKVYLFGDNLIGKGKKGQAIIRDEPNAFGIPTKKKPSMDKDAFMTDAEYAENIKAIDKAFDIIPKDKTIVLPKDGLGTGLAELQTRAPKTFEYLQNKLVELKPEALKVKAPIKEEVEISNLGSTNEDNVGVEPITDTQVGSKASNIIKYSLPDIFKGVKSPEEFQNKTDLLSDKLGNILENNMTKKTGISTNESATVVKEMQEMLLKDYNYKIENMPRFEGNIRQWLSRKNNNEPTSVLTTDGENLYSLDVENPKNRAGNRKVLEEPYKFIDKLWQEETGRDERAFTYLDHIVVKGESGNKEITLKKFREDEFSDYGGEADYNELVSTTMKKMEKQGFYYWGGKGTNDRLYFMRYHPETNKLKMADITKNFKLSDINTLRKQFDEKYGVSGDYFDKAFKSNVLWTMRMNGMDFTPESLRKILSTDYVKRDNPKIKLSKQNYDKLSEKIQDMYKPESHFLKDVIAFNKRLPLWMTDSYPAEKEYFTNPKSPGYIDNLTKDGNLRIKITPDFHQDRGDKFQKRMKEDSEYSDIKSTDTPEHLDGGITGHDKVVRALNLEAGNPESRTNKSLVVSPDTELGALLLKHAIHPAGKKQSAEMKELGIHLEIPASVAKQMGLRDFHTIYELDPSHIYQDYGVKQSRDFIKSQTIKKPFMTNLVESLAKSTKTKDNVTMDEVVKDIHDTIHKRRFLGTEEGVKSLNEYLDKLPTASDKELAEAFDKLDFDKIGLTHVVNALNMKGNQLFVNKFYEKLLLNRVSSLKEDLQTGEIGQEQYDSGMKEVEEYHSPAQKMISAARKDAIKRGKPENQAAIFTHPAVNKFREKLLSSYIVSQATKPKIANSAASVIRPYDEYLQVDADNVNPRLKNLNKDNTLFFMGDMHKKKMIDTDIPGLERVSLGELWKMYEGKSFDKQPEVKKQVEEIFRAAVIRVPADSVSGTQVLKFSGFTGRNDYGVLMHGLKERALGGADHDIDSAYIYFGGKGGMKKSWKDIIEENVDEFYERVPGEKLEIENYNLLQSHAKKMINKKVGPGLKIKSVELIGSTAKKGKGKDYDILYDIGKTRFEEELDLRRFGEDDLGNFPIISQIKGKKVDTIVKVYDIESKQNLYFHTDPTKPTKWMMEMANQNVIESIESGPKINLLEKTPRKDRFKISGNKESEFQDKLIKEYSAKEDALFKSKAGMFAPNSRLQASQGANTGRALLGGAAVNPKNLIGAAYDAIVRKGSDKFEVEDSKGNTYEVELIPKTSSSEKTYINKLMRSMMGFSSDAMDYGEPTGYKDWYKQALEAHFTIKSSVPDIIDKVGVSNFREGGVLGMINNANKAYYGKDFTRGRQWTMEDRRSLTKDLMLESDEHVRTITPRIAKLLYGIDYSAHALRKIDRIKLNDLFNNYYKNIQQYDSLKNPLGRRTLSIKTYKYINDVFKYNLLNKDSLERVAKNETEFNKIIKGTPHVWKSIKVKKAKGKFTWEKSKTEKASYTLPERIDVLNQIVESAGDFAMRDIETLVTIREVSKDVDALKKKFPNENVDTKVTKAHEKAEYLKAHNYLLREDRNSLDSDITNSKQTKHKTKGTGDKDQNEIDKEIREWKKGKTIEEKRLFDTLLLGSLNRGKVERLNELNAIKKQRKFTFKEQLEYNKEMKNTARTSSSMLGYNSEALEKGSLERFVGEMNNIYSEVSEQRAPEEVRKMGKILVSEPQKQENIEKGFPEKPNEELEKVKETYYTHKTGWEGVKEAITPKLDAEHQSYVEDVIAHLKLENNKLTQNFHLLVRKVLRKDLNLMNKQDWFAMKNWFDDIKTGNIHQRWKKFTRGEDFTMLSQRHYMQFPETNSLELMRDEIQLMQQEGIFLTAEGPRKGKVAKPTQFLDMMQRDVSGPMDAALGLNDDLAYKNAKKFRFLEGIEDGQALWEVAMAERQLGVAEDILKNIDTIDKKEKNMQHFKANQYIKVDKNMKEAHNYEVLLKDKMYNLRIGEEKISESGKDIVKRINELTTEFYKEQHKLSWGNVELDANKNIKKYTTDAGNEVYVLQDAILRGVKDMTSGPKDSGYIKKTKEFPEGYYDPETRQTPVIDIPKFVNDMKGWIAKGNKIPMEFGNDGMNTIARSMMYEMVHSKTKKNVKRDNPTFSKKAIENETRKLSIDMFNTYPERTGKIRFDAYFTHMHFDKKTALKGLEEYVKEIERSNLSPEEKEKLIPKLTYRYHALTGEWKFEDIDTWTGYDSAMEEISGRQAEKDSKINWVDNISKAGPQFKREGHIPGYSFDRQVPVTYGKSLNNVYFRQLAQIFARDTINKFDKYLFEKKAGKEQQTAWTNFAKLWVQGAIGNPDVVPEWIYENPAMKIKSTPYGWWADNRAKNLLNKVADTIRVPNESLPENLRGFDLNDVKRWSNLEARFELATLLAHPRSMVNNIFGGTLHTVQSVGLRTFMNARSDKYMATINEAWNSKHGRNTMAVKHGIFPEQLMEEYALNPSHHTPGNKSFIENLAKKIIRDPDVSSESVRDLAKKGNVTKPIMELAAKFMSIPERALRRDAFMSHYLYWYERLGGNFKDFDHPVIVELAKKGVKATQFLYSAPYRPMFARTALGKVMTRFQMWGWNAVRFRKEALKQARIYGFRGDEANRAARIMQLDLFVFALGNAFTYSLFESAMPAPWNWMQDTSEWIFGDEKERNRAFFGQWPRAIAPLQMVTPPLARMPLAAMRAVLEDDWSRIADHYIYTMFPFGRIAKDFIGKRNLIENPVNVVDKWTGFPLMALSRKSKEFRSED